MFIQVHGAQHGGPGPTVGSAGPTGHAHEAQSGATDPGQEHHRRVGGEPQGVHDHVQVSVLLLSIQLG